MRANLPTDYPRLLEDIKEHIRIAQVKANLAANRELVLLYWEIGRLIARRQRQEGWGTGVIPRLSRDLKNELPDIKGFSERNLKRMTQFFQEYPSLYVIGQQAVAQLKTVENEKDINVPQAVAQLTQSEQADLQHLIAQLPWGHNILLIQKIKDLNERLWYMRQTIEDGWSRNILDLQIKNNAYKRAAKAVTNFERTLPSPQSDLVQQTLKDPYIFDFLTLDEPFRERELETGLIRHLERFLIELGQGFSFVGRQYHLDIGEKDFYIDLLFYHLKLRCFVVIDLKKGEFKPDYAGKINFYCNVVDDMLKHETDNPTIGLILCQDKNKVLAEYALRGMNKPIGISEYELTRALPEELKSSLPTIEEIEAELGMDGEK